MPRLFDTKCNNCDYKEEDVLFRDNGDLWDGDSEVCPACGQGVMVKMLGTFKSINMNPASSTKEGVTSNGTKFKAELTPKRYVPGKGLK